MSKPDKDDPLYQRPLSKASTKAETSTAATNRARVPRQRMLDEEEDDFENYTESSFNTPNLFRNLFDDPEKL